MNPKRVMLLVESVYSLPTPSNPTAPGKAYNFELNGALWFGMALCDTQSYPEQVSTCTPDSDSNIVDPAVSPNHPGTAFMELQFYPPGWVPWPTWAVAIGADDGRRRVRGWLRAGQRAVAEGRDRRGDRGVRGERPALHREGATGPGRADMGT